MSDFATWLSAITLSLPLTAPEQAAVSAELPRIEHALLQPAESDAGAETAQTATDVISAVNQLQATYDSITDFSCEFTQTYANPTMGTSQTSTGVVYFMRPGKMRWDYQTPTVRHLIADGQTLWSVEPEFAQYYTMPLEDSSVPTALRFLTGNGRLSEEFDVQFGANNAESRIELELVPRTPDPNYAKLLFVVDPTSWRLLETTIVDPLGSTNTLVFTGMEVNSGFDASAFTYTPEPHMKLVEGP